MKIHLICIALVSFSAFSFANSGTTWHWSFDQQSIDVTFQSTITGTVVNDATSLSDIVIEGIVLRDFGNLGLLYEPGFKGVITPTVLGSHLVLHPGEAVSVELLEFHLSPGNEPSTTASYTIAPRLVAIVGDGCSNFHFSNQDICSIESVMPSNTLRISASAVPESSSLIYLALGLAAFFIKYQKR